MSQDKYIKSIAKSMERIVDILESDLHIKQSAEIIARHSMPPMPPRGRAIITSTTVPDYRTGGVNDRD